MRCIRDTYAMHYATHHTNYISGLHPRISDSLLHLEVFALETLFRDGVAFYSATRLHQPPFRGSLYDNFIKRNFFRIRPRSRRKTSKPYNTNSSIRKSPRGRVAPLQTLLNSINPKTRRKTRHPPLPTRTKNPTPNGAKRC